MKNIIRIKSVFDELKSVLKFKRKVLEKECEEIFKAKTYDLSDYKIELENFVVRLQKASNEIRDLVDFSVYDRLETWCLTYDQFNELCKVRIPDYDTKPTKLQLNIEKNDFIINLEKLTTDIQNDNYPNIKKDAKKIKQSDKKNITTNRTNKNTGSIVNTKSTSGLFDMNFRKGDNSRSTSRKQKKTSENVGLDLLKGYNAHAEKTNSKNQKASNLDNMVYIMDPSNKIGFNSPYQEKKSKLRNARSIDQHKELCASGETLVYKNVAKEINNVSNLDQSSDIYERALNRMSNARKQHNIIPYYKIRQSSIEKPKKTENKNIHEKKDSFGNNKISSNHNNFRSEQKNSGQISKMTNGSYSTLKNRPKNYNRNSMKIKSESSFDEKNEYPKEFLHNSSANNIFITPFTKTRGSEEKITFDINLLKGEKISVVDSCGET